MTDQVQRPYRLGLDLGTNSLGWFIVWLRWDAKLKRHEPSAIGPGGVRIFSDGRLPKSKSSKAAERRTARSARKRRDRFLMRQKTVMSKLVRYGLMPSDIAERKKLENLDPYQLRAQALDEKLPLHHLGRAIFHLNQRRGFESNRKTDSDEKQKGAIKIAAKHLAEMIAETSSRTLGEFLWKRHQKREGVRARNTSTGPKVDYDFYPTRQHLKDEFDAIWGAQACYHPELADDIRQNIHDAVFFQRDLRPGIVGKCSLSPAQEPIEKDPDGYRLSWSHPLAQRFRILQDLSNLEIQQTGQNNIKLSAEQRETVYRSLLGNNKMSFDNIRKLLKLPSDARFNIETEKRTFLKGDELAERLTNKNLFHKAWRGYDLDRQIRIAEKLLSEPHENVLISWLMEECKIERDRAERIADVNPLEGYCRLGLRAIRKMLPHFEAGQRYDEAANSAGYHHSDRRTGEILDELPYYGQWLPDAVVGTGDPEDDDAKRFGRFPNPTVHIGLGQIRRVVNKLIGTYGHPTEIVIELARDLQVSPEKKKEIEAEQTKNQQANDENRSKFEELGLKDATGLPRRATRDDLLKMRLWNELGAFAQCPFSGRTISLSDLHSHKVEIEHLIPFADSLDNKARNLTVCFKDANRLKGKQTPYEAFGHLPEWPNILARANALPANKRWRFSPDARERLNRGGRDFLDRQLHETRWLGRVAAQYLQAICDPNKVWAVTGQHTALIRAKWGLNSLLPDHNFTDAKKRADHRHHAIDAFVVAMTSRSLLQQIARAYDVDRDKVDVPKPWENIREDLGRALDHIIASHRADHGVEGKLHDETAYGFVAAPKEPDKNNLVFRKPLSALTDGEIDNIRDDRLRGMVRDFVDQEVTHGMKLTDALKKFQTTVRDPHIKHGLRRVRLFKTKDQKYLLQLSKKGENAAYKAYAADANLFMEIYVKIDGEWGGEAVTVYQANR
ncbi:MAG: type II CRISPR RNA-guided endonuclease Cas9, partial [Variibacter sp.]